MPKPIRHVVVKDPNHHTYDQYDATKFDPKDLPVFVDLRPHLTPVENQGQIGSCTANALVGAYEYLEKRMNENGGNVRDISRLFIYYNERNIEGTVGNDAGAALSDGVKALKKYGACTEDTWPYDEGAFKTKPPTEAFTEASDHKITEAQTVAIDVDAMRHCLAEGYPFVFGVMTFKSFDVDAKGRIPDPTPPKDEQDGGHAMLCVGYSDKDKMFLVRNSWGPKWGIGGYCLISYDYLSNPDYAHDAWTINRAHDLDLNQGVGETDPPHGDRVSFLDGKEKVFTSADSDDEDEDEDEDGEEEDEDEDEDAEDGDEEDSDEEDEDEEDGDEEDEEETA